MMARKAVNTTRQGANFELMIMHDLDRYGYLTMRSSGSRGAVDVMAVGDNTVLTIQAKITNPLLPPGERKAVTELADRIGAPAVPLVAYRLKGQVGYRLLTGTGPKDFLIWAPEPTKYALCGREGCGHSFGRHTRELCWEVEENGKYHCLCSQFLLADRA